MPTPEGSRTIPKGLLCVLVSCSLSLFSFARYLLLCSSSASKPCHGNPPALFFFLKGQEVLHPRPPCSRPPPPPTCSGEAFRNRKGCSGRFTGTVRMLKRETCTTRSLSLCPAFLFLTATASSAAGQCRSSSRWSRAFVHPARSPFRKGHSPFCLSLFFSFFFFWVRATSAPGPPGFA